MEPSLDPDLTARLTAAADDVDAAPDLGAVHAGADQRRRRQRTLGLGGALAVGVLGIGGIVVVANRDPGDLPAAQPEPIVVPLTTTPLAGSPEAGTPAFGTEAPADTSATDAPPSIDRTAADSPGAGFPEYDPNAPDPAEPYLELTREVYRREMPSGTDVRVRVSDVSYGELFGIEWDLPTGTAEACLGGDAVFIGSPDGPPQWLSTWTVRQWAPVDPAQEITIEEYYTGDTSNLVVRTELPATYAAIEMGGEELDRTDFVDGIAVVEMTYPNQDVDGSDASQSFDPMVTVAVDAGGEEELRTVPLYGEFYGVRDTPQECFGPPPPGSELPDPGVEQPTDPSAAQASIRERHALLVDQSLTDADKPADLLTDASGVAEARAQMEAGAFADSAAEATYAIDGLVFADATTAWFEYTIDTPAGSFGERFGQAIFNGEVWQITRATICQDLALAGGYCDPGQETETVRPPLPNGVDFDTAMSEWSVLSTAYGNKLNCNPLNLCGDFDPTGRLPEPGEQPADGVEASAEVVRLMESMYGGGGLRDRLDSVDDPTGIADTLDRIAAGTYGGEVSSAVAEVGELVFTSPDSASFRYSIRTDDYSFDQRVGTAVRIDGVWKITRATICADLALAQTTCDPLD